MENPNQQRYYWHSDPWEEDGRAINVWVRPTGALVGSLLLLAVAARAAGSVSGERSRQTLDELLTSPLTNAEIVHAKWWGSLLGLRLGWLWLGSIYFIAMALGGTNFLGAFLAVAAWFCFAAFMARFWLWFSVQNRSPLRAGRATILSASFLLGWHGVL